MSIFSTDETAWSALTKALENVIQPSGATVIVQAPTVFRPLAIQAGVDRRLSMFRKLLIGDKIPNYGNKNKNSYLASGASVQAAYVQYLQELNVALTNKYAVSADINEINSLRDQYNSASKALSAFDRAAAKDWAVKKRANPGLTRLQWDKDYGDIGYTNQYNELFDDVTASYGAWQAKAKPYPELTRVANKIYDCNNNPVNRIPLPTNDDELNDPPESWTPFLKSNLDLQDFLTSDARQGFAINQASSTSTSYQSRWEAGGSVSYGFFSIGGSAGGGSIENHLRAGAQALNFSFARLMPVSIIRGSWYDEGLIRLPYNGYVDKTNYWSPNGQLPLIPIMVLLGRGLQVSIATDSVSYDEFQSWHHSGGSAGFSFGPWSVGGGANSSTSSSSVTNTSTGTTISFTDSSITPYVLAVVSLKMDEWLTRSVFLAEGKAALSALSIEAKAHEERYAAALSE
jgi:uncharacterized membrane protein YgcG